MPPAKAANQHLYHIVQVVDLPWPLTAAIVTRGKVISL
jgi:hypothetical protein